MRIRCQAVRYFAEPQPGVIEAYLTDLTGFRWQIVEKTVVFHEWALFDSEPPPLPIDVSVDCTIVADDGKQGVWITIPALGDRVYSVDRGDIIDPA